MKKILGIVVLGLLWCNISQAVTLKNIDEVEILIEQSNIESQKLCNLYERDIRTSLEYIVSNSKLKIRSGDNLKLPVLYVAGGIHHNSSLCSGSIILQLWRLSLSDPLEKGNIGKFVYFDRNAFMSASHSDFKRHYLDFLEDLAKEFVIEWNKFN